MKNTKQVIVVRKDLGMGKGKIAVQVAHGSLGCILKQMGVSLNAKIGVYSRILSVGNNAPIAHWLSDGFTKIVVYVSSEQELLELQVKAEENGILNCLITDSGATEFHGVPTITVLALGPEWSEDLDKITQNLPLL